MTNSQQHICLALERAFETAIDYGCDSCDEWFPNSEEVDRAWNYLIEMLDLFGCPGLRDCIKVEDGTIRELWW